MSFSTVPQASVPTVCHGLPHPCEVASPSDPPVLEARPSGRGWPLSGKQEKGTGLWGGLLQKHNVSGHICAQLAYSAPV